MDSNKILILLIIISSLYAKEEKLVWEKLYNLEISSSVFIRKVEKWVKNIDKKKAIRLKIDSKVGNKIFGNGRIYIFQYESDELIPVEFDFFIDRNDLGYKINFFEIKIFEHEINHFQFQKDIELKKSKNVFKELSKELNIYLLKNENKFKNWFKVWLWKVN